MSDTEYSEVKVSKKTRPYSELQDPAPISRSTKPKVVKKKTPLPESGDEVSIPRSKKSKLSKTKFPLTESEDEAPTPRSKKLAQTSLLEQLNGPAGGWIIDSDSEDGDWRARKPEPLLLPSVLIRQVPGGRVRRTAQLSGDLFLELKLYNVADIKSISPKDRWEKALVNLKIQLDVNSSEVSDINKVLKLCKDYFAEDGTFYRDLK